LIGVRGRDWDTGQELSVCRLVFGDGGFTLLCVEFVADLNLPMERIYEPSILTGAAMPCPVYLWSHSDAR
jgi:hypothetical protein